MAGHPSAPTRIQSMPKELIVWEIGQEFGIGSQQYRDARHALAQGGRIIRAGMTTQQAKLAIATNRATGGRQVPKNVQVKHGENLAQIAKRFFGSERAVPFIVAQNQSKFKFKSDGTIDTTIFTGQSLNLPSSFDPDRNFDPRLADALLFGDKDRVAPGAPSTEAADLGNVKSNREVFQDDPNLTDKENRLGRLLTSGSQGQAQKSLGKRTAEGVLGSSLTPDFEPAFEGQFTGPVTRGWLTEEQQLEQIKIVGIAINANILPPQIHVQTAIAAQITSEQLIRKGYVRSAAGLWEYAGSGAAVDSGAAFVQDDSVLPGEDSVFGDAEEILEAAQTEKLSQDDRFQLFNILRTELRKLQRVGNQRSVRPGPREPRRSQTRRPRRRQVPPRFTLPRMGTSTSARGYGYLGSSFLDSRMTWS